MTIDTVFDQVKKRDRKRRKKSRKTTEIMAFNVKKNLFNLIKIRYWCVVSSIFNWHHTCVHVHMFVICEEQ